MFYIFLTDSASLCIYCFSPHIFHIYILRSDVFLMNLNEGIYSLSFKALFVRENANIVFGIMSFLF